MHSYYANSLCGLDVPSPDFSHVWHDELDKSGIYIRAKDRADRRFYLFFLFIFLVVFIFLSLHGKCSSSANFEAIF